MKDLKMAQSTAGFSNKRELMDNYPTPDIAIIELLKREDFPGIVWEPACGSGNIAKFFDGCMASDIRKSNIYGEIGIDFLFESRKVDCIITNPPFRYAQKFVEQALFCATKKVAMLLRVREGNNTMEGKSSMLAFAWFVWEHRYEGKPMIEWINTGK